MRRSGFYGLAVLAAVASAGLGAAFLATGGARAGACDDPQSAAGTACVSTDVTTTSTDTTGTTTDAPGEPMTPAPSSAPKPKPSSGAGPKPAPQPTRPETTSAAAAPTAKPRPNRTTPPLGAGPYLFPVYGPVSFSDTFGAGRSDTGWHHGGDIFAPLGAPVLAVADGSLFLVGWNDIGGNRLWLRDRLGNYFYYAHMAAFSTAAFAGSRVKAGTVLGFVGATGDAQGTPYHLHFEIHPASLLTFGYDGGAVDPTPYLHAWQRLGGIRLSTDDAKLIRAAGWSATLALPSSSAQPGAILLQSSDISSAPTLDPKSVARVVSPVDLEQRIAKVRLPTPAPAAHVHPSPSALRQVLRVEGLDRAASLPPGFPALTVWDTLSRCEAGGDWSANTGNGFYGGLQFTAETWLENGGTAFAPTADQASRQQQIAVAQRVLATQGWIAWPVCSARLGLR